MKKSSALGIFFVVLSSLAYSYEINQQDATGRIVGTWKSLEMVNGESQAVLTISRNDNKLSGGFVFRGVTIDGRENSTVELALSNIVYDGTTLSFSVTFPGAEKLKTDWALKLQGENEGNFNLTREEGKSIEDGPSFKMKRAKPN